MYTEEFAGCCGAYIIFDFGGGGRYDAEHYSKQRLIKDIVKELTELKHDSKALVFATVTITQPNAKAALEQLGFYGYDKKEGAHRSAYEWNEDSDTVEFYGLNEHTIFPFFLALEDWDEEQFWKDYNPDKDTYKNGPHTFKDNKKEINPFR